MGQPNTNIQAYRDQDASDCVPDVSVGGECIEYRLGVDFEEPAVRQWHLVPVGREKLAVAPSQPPRLCLPSESTG